MQGQQPQKMWIVSFDVEGTLGKQQTTITPEQQQSGCMDETNIVDVPGDPFGPFVFFESIVWLLVAIEMTIQDDTRSNNGVRRFDMIFTTGSFRSPGAQDRNELIMKYVTLLLYAFLFF